MATIRASELTHQRLKEISKTTGQSIQAVLDLAVNEYRKQVFLTALNEDFARLREDPAKWAEELEERKLWEGALADGLENEVSDKNDLSA